MATVWAVILTIRGTGEGSRVVRLPYGVGMSAVEAASATTRAIADYADKGTEPDQFGTEFVSLLVKCYDSENVPNAFDTDSECVECGARKDSICWESCSSWQEIN